MNLREALIIRNTLRDLIIGEDHPEGICVSLDTALGLPEQRTGYYFVKRVSQNWPLCLKGREYMVPNPDDPEYPANSYTQHHRQGTLWKGAYGDNRRSLALFLLEDIEARIRKLKKTDEYLRKMRVRKAMRAVLTKPLNHVGICDQPSVQALTCRWYEYIVTWQHYNGSLGYFIPHPAHLNNRKYNMGAYHRFPKWEGAQGKLRCDFLKHVIAETTKEINALEIIL